MKERLYRDVLEIRQLRIPLQVLAQEFAWEKEHNEYTGRENPQAFENFASLWSAIRERSTLFQEDAYGPPGYSECTTIVRAAIDARTATAKNLNRISELLTKGENACGMNARMAEAAQIAAVLCSHDLPSLMDSLQNALHG